MKVPVDITVNGRTYSDEVEPRQLLVHFIRENAALTGTKVACDTSQCGSCTVTMDGVSVKSCTTLTVQANGSSITTIEGLSDGVDLHPLQEAFWNNHGLQCGFCTPGMIMAASELLRIKPGPFARRNPGRAGGQPLPMHRISKHRAGRRRRSTNDGRLDHDDTNVRFRNSSS